MHSNAVIARALAAAFLADTFDIEGCVDRGAQLLGKRWRWLRPLARRVSDAFSGRTRPRQIELVGFLRRDKGFLNATEATRVEVGRPIDRSANDEPCGRCRFVGRAGNPQLLATSPIGLVSP